MLCGCIFAPAWLQVFQQFTIIVAPERTEKNIEMKSLPSRYDRNINCDWCKKRQDHYYSFTVMLNASKCSFAFRFGSACCPKIFERTAVVVKAIGWRIYFYREKFKLKNWIRNYNKKTTTEWAMNNNHMKSLLNKHVVSFIHINNTKSYPKRCKINVF